MIKRNAIRGGTNYRIWFLNWGVTEWGWYMGFSLPRENFFSVAVSHS